jgi:hypothetical protein
MTPDKSTSTAESLPKLPQRPSAGHSPEEHKAFVEQSTEVYVARYQAMLEDGYAQERWPAGVARGEEYLHSLFQKQDHPSENLDEALLREIEGPVRRRAVKLLEEMQVAFNG